MTDSQCMGRLLASATHDMRNVLAVIRESAGEKVLIKDNTVGLTQKTVLSGKLLEREFGIRARYSYRTQIRASSRP